MKSVGHALVEAVLAAAIVGAFEATRVATATGASRAWPVTAAVAMAGALALTFGGRALVAGLARVPLLATWRRELATGAREVAAWRALLVTGAFVAFAIASYRLTSWAHESFRFRDGDSVGLLLACTLTPTALLVVAGARAADHVVAPRLRDRTLLAGRRAAVAGALAAVLALVVPPWLVGRALPALGLAPAVTACVIVVAVVVARALRAGRVRAAQVAAAVACLAALVGTWQLASAPRARGEIIVHGVTSRAFARTLWALADRDRDGYPGPSVGGADCDDGDPQRHPAAVDIAGNGRDENCTGADARVADVDARARAAPAPAPEHAPNIVLITIDALRADHLGAYGYARKTSPTLDQLAATATRFATAFTSCPSTRCAIPSLLTGRYASTLGRGAERDNLTSLPLLLQQAGYETAAITCCDRFSLARRELRGFAVLDTTADTTRMQRAGQSNADEVADNAVKWLASRPQPARPYFMWLHFYEPHYPYAAPSGPDFGPRDVDRYDTEIAYFDEHLARVLAALDPSTVVVVTADHGEEFGEHGVRFHARSMYNANVRVPLIVRAPGFAPRVVDAPASIIDVTPTLLELAGVAHGGMNGVSLTGAMRTGTLAPRPLLIELLPDHQIERDMVAVIQAPFKAIWDRAANAWSLYRLDDAADTTDVVDDPALSGLQQLLRDTVDRETSRLP